MTEHDKLIDALEMALARRDLSEFPPPSTIKDQRIAIDGATTARQAIVEYIEQRTLTLEDALAIVCDDLLDVPSRSKRASALVDKCVGIIEEHDADVPFLSAPPEI